MKKISFIAFIAAGLFISACNNKQQAVGSNSDSGSVGNSGPADTTQAVQGSTTGATASGTATSGSDTSTTKH